MTGRGSVSRARAQLDSKGRILRRLVHALVTLAGITMISFIVIHAAPGDPIEARFAAAGGGAASPQAIESLRRDYGLDQPLTVQYLQWVKSCLTLDFGRSLVSRRAVIDQIAGKLPATLLLNVSALGLALLIAIPLGVITGAQPGSRLDRASGLLLLALYSIPGFWAALLLIEFFAVKLDLLPLYGMHSAQHRDLAAGARLLDLAAHMLLPTLALAFGQIALFARFSRNAMVSVMAEPYIAAARARGVGEFRVLFVHGFRNALIPVISLLGLTLPHLLSGSVIIERIFEWDGVGRLYFDAILARDYPVVMALTFLTAAATLAVNIAADWAYTLADPRLTGNAAPL